MVCEAASVAEEAVVAEELTNQSMTKSKNHREKEKVLQLALVVVEE